MRHSGLMRTSLRGLVAAAALALALGGASPIAAQDQPAAPAPTRAEILRTSRDKAIDEILAASRSEDPFMRANAIEAMGPVRERQLPLAQIGVEDDAAVVRFSALVAIGRLKAASMGDAAVQLTNDKNPSVRAAALFAAHQCGRQVNLGELAGLLASTDPGTRANAAMLVAEMGNASAIPMLREMARRPMRRALGVSQTITRIQMAEAVVKLGEDEDLDAIRAAAYSPHGEVRVLALQMLGRLGDQRMRPGIERIASEPGPIEVRLAASEAAARMGSDQGFPVMLEGAASELAPVRAQAAFTLGALGTDAAVAKLAELLDDPQQQVRVSAGAALLHLMEPAGE